MGTSAPAPGKAVYRDDRCYEDDARRLERPRGRYPPADHARATACARRRHTGRATTWPRARAGRRRWHLLTDSSGVTAITATGTVAGARISAGHDGIVVEFWSDAFDAPGALRAQLVQQLFAHPAVEPHRPAVVCVPRGDSTVIAEVRRRLARPRTRVAGSTCLITGAVREGPRPAP